MSITSTVVLSVSTVLNTTLDAPAVGLGNELSSPAACSGTRGAGEGATGATHTTPSTSNPSGELDKSSLFTSFTKFTKGISPASLKSTKRSPWHTVLAKCHSIPSIDTYTSAYSGYASQDWKL